MSRHDVERPATICSCGGCPWSLPNPAIGPLVKALREIAKMRFTMAGIPGAKLEATFVAEEALKAYGGFA